MDATVLHRRCVASWQRLLDGVEDGQWQDATPCQGWTVRDLVGHVVGEELWATPLVRGATLEEVGDRYDGDNLGEDPAGAGRAAGAAAADAVDAVPAGSKVNLSYGEESLEEYVRQLSADHLVHGWDLAAATGQSRELDADLVAEVAGWFAEREEMYRSFGIVGPVLDRSGDPQTELLAHFGRDADWTAAR